MILPEIVSVGIYDSQIAAKNIVISKNRKTSMFEIELPIENGGVSYIDSNSKRIEPNMIIHSGTLYDTLMNIPDFFETDKKENYKKIFTKLINYYNTLSDSEEIILQSLILELIYTIAKDSTKRNKNGNSNNNYTVIEKSLKYIKEHLTEELSLEKVAKAVSLSPIHFHNNFKTAVGKTLRNYVEEQRIKKAINLLLTTNFSLTQIAYDCGFSSQSYFSYAFKRKMKVTPREYVREIYNKYEI